MTYAADHNVANIVAEPGSAPADTGDDANLGAATPTTNATVVTSPVAMLSGIDHIERLGVFLEITDDQNQNNNYPDTHHNNHDYYCYSCQWSQSIVSALRIR